MTVKNKKVRKNKKKQKKTPIIFDDVFNAAIDLVKSEHPSDPLCPKCKKVILQLIRAKKTFSQAGMGHCLVEPAVRFGRRQILI